MYGRRPRVRRLAVRHQNRRPLLPQAIGGAPPTLAKLAASLETRDRYAVDPIEWRHGSQQEHRLSSEHLVDVSNAGNVSAGPPEAGYEPTFNGIIAHDHDDRDSGGRFLDDWSLLTAKRENHLRIGAYQSIGKLRESFVICLRVVIVDGDSLSVNIAQSPQAPNEWVNGDLVRFRKEQYADTSQPRRRLLRERYGRPRRCTTNKRNELPPLHSPLPRLRIRDQDIRSHASSHATARHLLRRNRRT